MPKSTKNAVAKVREHRLAIVVDSSACLPSPIHSNIPLRVVPMKLTLGDSTFLDGVDLSSSAFYRTMRRNLKVPPVTSAPSPGAFLNAFRDVSKSASSILCLTVSPRFSSSYYSSRAAAMQASNELPDTEISVIDTESAAGGHGLVALAAVRASERGGGLVQAISAARSVIENVTLLAFLDTLYFVWKGGRVKAISYAGTAALRIKPLFELRRGEIFNIGRPRTTSRATEKLMRILEERAGSRRLHAAVMHGDSPELANEIRNKIENLFECQEIYVSECSPVMGSHAGPGLVGVAFWSESL